MGTHPIFESDFDCLTDSDLLVIFSSKMLSGLIRNRAFLVKRAANYHNNPLLPRKFQIKDPALLDETKLKHEPRKLSFFNLLKLDAKLTAAKTQKVWQTGHSTLRYISILIFISACFMFVNIFYPLIQEAFDKNAQEAYSEKAYKELCQLLNENDFDFKKCKDEFYALSFYSLLTSRLATFLAADLTPKLNFMALSIPAEKRKFVFVIVNSVKVAAYLNGNLQSNNTSFFRVSNTATQFCQFFMTSPLLTLQVMQDMSRSYSEAEDFNPKTIRVNEEKYFLSLLLRREILDHDVKLEIVKKLFHFHGITDYLMEDIDLKTALSIVHQASEENEGRKHYTKKSEEILNKLSLV